tara:strand:+ start:9905 stop:10423 length:519 start_codon:yes stop_codon:yes gene_type:complete
MPNIFLTGYRATGKTSVAQLVADQLGLEAIDADVFLESEARMTIAEIFEAEGEQGFRERESSVVHQLAQRDELVVALGGGAIVREENRRAIQGRGVTVWLTASPEIIFDRMSTDPLTGKRRPNLTATGGLQEIQQLLEQRNPLYQEVADFSVDTEQMTPAEVAGEIIAKLRD